MGMGTISLLNSLRNWWLELVYLLNFSASNALKHSQNSVSCHMKTLIVSMEKAPSYMNQYRRVILRLQGQSDALAALDTSLL